MAHSICENSRCQRQWNNNERLPSHYCNDACMAAAHRQLTRGHSVLSEPRPLPSPRATRTIAEAARQLAALGDSYGESRREADMMLTMLTGRPSHATALDQPRERQPRERRDLTKRRDLTGYERRKI